MLNASRPKKPRLTFYAGLALLNLTGCLFGTAQAETAVTEGLDLSRNHCARCHIVETDKPFTGISSTPSFSLLVNALQDWEDRFSAFYALRPHPAFTRMEGLENPLANNPSTVPMELKLDDVDKIIAYVRTLKKAN